MTQELWNEEVQWTAQYKTQEMCNEAVKRIPWMLEHVPDQYKTQEMCDEAVQSYPWVLEHVPDQYKTQEMCDEAVEKSPAMVEHVPDPYKTQKMWYEEFEDDEELIMWRDAYIKCKIQKAKIEEELMSVAWHPDRWWNWCVPEDEKKELEKYFSKNLGSLLRETPKNLTLYSSY